MEGANIKVRGLDLGAEPPHNNPFAPEPPVRRSTNFKTRFSAKFPWANGFTFLNVGEGWGGGGVGRKSTLLSLRVYLLVLGHGIQRGQRPGPISFAGLLQ